MKTYCGIDCCKDRADVVTMLLAALMDAQSMKLLMII